MKALLSSIAVCIAVATATIMRVSNNNDGAIVFVNKDSLYEYTQVQFGALNLAGKDRSPILPLVLVSPKDLMNTTDGDHLVRRVMTLSAAGWTIGIRFSDEHYGMWRGIKKLGPVEEVNNPEQKRRTLCEFITETKGNFIKMLKLPADSYIDYTWKNDHEREGSTNSGNRINRKMEVESRLLWCDHPVILSTTYEIENLKVQLRKGEFQLVSYALVKNYKISQRKELEKKMHDESKSKSKKSESHTSRTSKDNPSKDSCSGSGAFGGLKVPFALVVALLLICLF